MTPAPPAEPRAPTDAIVIDANIVFVAFIRDGATREIIMDHGLALYTPPWLWEELAARYDWLHDKTHLPRAALDQLLRQVRDRILDVPMAALEAHREEALRRVGADNRKDAPYVAAALAVRGAIWTHDARLSETAGVPIVTTAKLLGRP